MPRFSRRRRAPIRRRRPARRNIRRRARRVPRPMGRNGGLVLLRRSPQVMLRSSQSASGAVVEAFAEGVSDFNPLNVGTLTGDGMNNYDVPFAFLFKLDSVTNSTELTAISDRYRIDKVWIRAFYTCGIINGASTPAQASNVTFGAPFISYYVDYDDATPPTIADLNERMGTRMAAFKPGRFIQMSVRPKFAVGIQDDDPAVVSAYPRHGFIDCAQPDVPHYGIKGAIRGLALNDADLAGGVFVGVKFDICYKLTLRDIS